MPTPRVRTDLIVTRQEVRGGTVYVLKDPATSQFFRFGEVEYFIIERLGTGPSDQILAEVQSRYGAALPPDTLAQFIDQLGRYGLLGSARPRAKRSSRPRGGMFYMRFKAFDPDRLLGAVERNAKFLFTPYFVVLSGITVLIGAAIVIGHASGLVHELGHLHPAAWAIAWIVIIAVGMAHELAHGLTCKHFGGEVHEIGFLLLYFQPALYCNVSDAWLFPEKSNRLWVMFAGSYFELFLWALASIVWFVTQPHTPVHDLSLVIAATSGVKTLLNFNPLLKLDGYYMLSDVLEIPNLRSKSFRAIGGRLKRWIAGRGVPEPLPVRERKAILVFGWTAVTFSIVFLGALAARLGAPLFARYHLLGVVPFATMLGLALQRRFGALFATVPVGPVASNGAVAGTHATSAPPLRSSPAPRSLPPETPVAPAPLPSTSESLVSARPTTEAPPVTVHPGPAPAPTRPAPRKHRWVRPLVMVLFAGLAVLVLLAHRELQVGGQFVIAPLQKADVRAQIDGIVANVLVHEGQVLEAGDPVVRLSAHEVATELRKNDSDLEEKRALLAFAIGNLDRSRTLYETDVLSKKEYESAQQDVTMKRAEVARLESDRRLTREQASQSVIVTPIAGIVTTPQQQLAELTGRFMHKGDLVAQVYQMTTVSAEISVPEKEIADVAVGQPIVLKTRAYPQWRLVGHVTAIGVIAQQDVGSANAEAAATHPDPGSKFVLVTTHLDNPALRLKPQMTGAAKIQCGDRRVADLVMRSLSRTLRVEFWSWW